jgi:RNA polymerase sigma factor (sigma-70 family)
MITTEFEKYKYLIHHIICKHYDYLIGTTYYDDAYQEGSIALLKAIKNFDSQKGNKLNTYAYHTIRGTIQKKINHYFSQMTITKYTNKIYAKYKELQDKGYSFDEIVKEINTTPLKLTNIINSYRCKWLDENIYKESDNPLTTAKDILADDFNIESDFETKHNLKIIENLCTLFLSKNDYLAIKKYYSGMSQLKIAKLLKKSYSCINQKITKIEENIFPLFKKYILGNISFGLLCLEMLKYNRNYKHGMSTYLYYIFNQSVQSKEFIEEVQQELNNWKKEDLEKIKNYFNRNSNTNHLVVSILENIVAIIDRYYKIPYIEDILLKQKLKGKQNIAS